MGVIAAVTLAGVWILFFRPMRVNAQTLYTPDSEIAFFKGEVSFSSARTKCEKKGGHLLQIDKQLITELIVPHLDNDYWIGGTDEDSEGEFLWPDGKTRANGDTAPYTNWNSGEPNNGGSGEDCMAVKANGKWNDARCDRKFRYICEGDAKRVYTSGHELTFIRRVQNFTQARKLCQKMHGDLAKIDTDELHKAVTENVARVPTAARVWAFWLGAMDVGSGNQRIWEWIDGERVTHYHWRKKEPNGPSVELCLTAGLDSGFWGDSGCGRQEFYPLCQRERPIHITIEKHELTFYGSFDTFGDDKSYQEAKEACEEDGARLVEATNQDINDAIAKEAAVSEGGFWTGGHYVNGNWVWNDGATIQGDGFWKQPEVSVPSTRRCMSADWLGWEVTDCDTEKFYICEKVHAHDIKISSSSINVTGEEGHINCTASGVPTPTVQWMRETGESIPESSGFSVFQVSGAGFSRLVLDGANLSDTGTYFCVANNSGKHVITRINATAHVFVSGPPKIISIEPESCNSSIYVHWVVNKRAMSFPHRIITTTPNGTNVRVIEAIPSTAEQVTEIQDLSSSSPYNVTVFACSTDRCAVKFEAEGSSGASGGFPRPVANPILTQASANCRLTWSPPDITPSSVILGYVVNVTTALVKVRGDAPDPIVNVSNVTKEVLIYGISSSPNRRYTVEVQARTCAGTSATAQVNGTCVTKMGAPAEIPTPNISSAVEGEHGTRTIAFPLPDESNGPISCLFVIVKTDQDALDEAFTVASLEEAGFANGSSYIAIAIAFTSLLNRENQTFLLGDGSITSCNPFETNPTSSRRRRDASASRDRDYSAVNKELEPKLNYRVFLVSSTPTEDGDILFQKSAPISFTNVAVESAPTTSSSWIVPVAVVIGLLTLLLLVAMAVLARKRRNFKDSKGQGQGQRLNGVEDKGLDTVAYENIIMNKPKSGKGIPISDLLTVYKDLRRNGNKKFTDEFKEILLKASEDLSTKTIASNPDLKKKNRYKNILPYDHSRVVLLGSDTGYINACYINGFERAKKYIASQGPLPGTINDFWLMVVEQRCGVIVMLTREVESGKKKCEKYWPANGATGEYGNVIVEGLEEFNYSSFVKRTFRAKMKDEIYDNPLLITHYQFLRWPDHGVPPTTSNIMRMHRAVVESQANEIEKPPIIVHCSAGAGRSGTFIGYDILVDEYKKRGRVDVSGCVLNMRKQRVEMVQNCDQYVLLHKLVIESYEFGDTDMEGHGVEAKLKKSLSGNASDLTKEFNNLSKIGPMKNARSIGQAERNCDMNRNMDIIPYDYNSVKVTLDEGEIEAPYINASWVESYDKAVLIIAAQGPSGLTTELFWRMILDNNVTTIVMLGRVDEKEQVHQYWPETDSTTKAFGRVTVALRKEEEGTTFVERHMDVSRKTQMKTVTQFQFPTWETNACPVDGTVVVSLANKIQESIRSSKGVVLVHCTDGAGRTGTLCAVINLLERLKVENKADVFRTVKDLRDGRPGMVQTLEQYVFCHQVIVDYLKSFDLYSNF